MNNQVGNKTKTVEVNIDKYCTYYYAGASGDFNFIHLDDEYAKLVGLPGKIVHGLCTMAFTYKAIVGDNDPEKVKKFKVRFKSIVRPLDKLKVSYAEGPVENNLKSIDISVKNQKGEQVISNAIMQINV